MPDVFHEARQVFDAFSGFVMSVESLIAAQTRAILFSHASLVDRIESRTKAFDSIRDNYIGKFGFPAASIDLDEFLRDASDLVGIRIISYYNSDVDVIRDTLMAAYPQADLEEKLTVNDINRSSRFGYRAVHLNFEFDEPKMFRDQPCSSVGVEIQVRTVFSDAWARHSHKLVYKSDSPPNDEVLRLFASTSAMLEALDDQAERIRDLPKMPSRRQPSVELGWIEIYEEIQRILSRPIDEEILRSFYIATQDHMANGTPVDGTQFINEVRQAWSQHGNIAYEKYGFKDAVLQLRIALYGFCVAKYGWALPLHMKVKANNVLQVGLRSSEAGPTGRSSTQRA